MAAMSSKENTQTTLGRPREKMIEMIQEKAYELYERRGRISGHEWEDWFEAEKMVKRELGNSRRKAR